MSASQNASASEPSHQEGASAQAAHPGPKASAALPSAEGTVEATNLSLAEMLRVLEVARHLREERQVAEVALRRDELRLEIKRKLLASASVTGEEVSDAEIDAAIDQYFDSMHVLKTPSGMQSFLAHLYVLRRRVVAAAGGLAIAAAATWFAFFSPWAPLSPTVRAERAAAVRVENAESLQRQIIAASTNNEASAEANRLVAEIAAAGAENPAAAVAAHERLAELWSKMQIQYEVHVVSGGNEMSAFEREFTDAQGTRVAGYYVIVEARSPNGKILRQPIRNAETGKTETVSRWAERVPKEIYDRLRDDKTSDGVLNETLYSAKRLGEIRPEIVMPAAGGSATTPSAQITKW